MATPEGKFQQNTHKKSTEQKLRRETQQSTLTFVENTHQEQSTHRGQLREREQEQSEGEAATEIHPEITIIIAPPMERENTNQDRDTRGIAQEKPRDLIRTPTPIIRLAKSRIKNRLLSASDFASMFRVSDYGRS